MKSRTRRIVALAATIAGMAVVATPASAADFVVPFNNWDLGGTLTLKKLNQSVTLPPGSKFNGSANLTKLTLTGDVSIPTSTSTIRVLGIPTQVTLDAIETGPATGTLAFNGPNVTVNGSSSLNLFIRRITVLGIPLQSRTCRTSSPVTLPLNFTGPLDLNKGFTFTGTTTIPPLIGCGLLDGPLSLLMSGPGNNFSISISPPKS